jgi:hypothetical protein
MVASHDRNWSILLHCVGSVAPSLLERPSRRVQAGLADHAHLASFGRQDRQEREEAELEELLGLNI